MSTTSNVRRTAFTSKKEFTLPKGAEIISSTSDIYVQEIENGYVINKEYNVTWKSKDGSDSNHEYFTKSWYSKTNPVGINMPDDAKKSLADAF